jgi:aspartyl-tRNA(Asn)/glutamyl-tRNA(Gln) amidotransferase subunit C
MTTVTDETVEHVARLAQLSLTEQERSLFARQLAEILDYAESIQGVDLTDVPPMSHAQLGAALREDAPSPGLGRESALAGAPDTDAGLFRVPRVLGG